MNDDTGHSSARQQRSGQIVYVDRLLWQQLTQARSQEDFATAWLSLQCNLLDGIARGVVVLGEADTGPFRPVAVWPKDQTVSEALSGLAERALAERQGQIEPTGDGTAAIAFPLLIDGKVYGVAALECAANVDAQQHLRQLQWGAAWLEAYLRREQSLEDAQFNNHLMTVVDLIALALQQTRFRDAALAVATELATTLQCDRASIGFVRGGQCRVVAMSHSAQIGGQMNLVRAIEAAMDEALDARAQIAYPHADITDLQVAREHCALTERFGGGAVLSVPLLQAGEVVGVLTLERPADRPFEATTIELCRSIAVLAGPVLATLRRDDRPLVIKTAVAAREQLARLFGGGYLGRKLTLLGLAALLVFLTLAHGTFRVTADAALEGELRRVIAAPIDGYVLDAPLRAGDTFSRDDVLFALDDRDLHLERLQTDSERAQLQRRQQEAEANRERAQVRVLAAQIAQSDARLALIDAQIARTITRAPMDGTIVSGDLSQAIGTAVERGEVLFEIAPLQAYRVILRVDEHDIGELRIGQTGVLKLAALPDDSLAFAVTKITPVADAAEGINYFRVEASLTETSVRVRPGMEGVAKVEIEQRRLIEIWTRGLTTWLRLWLWSWWP